MNLLPVSVKWAFFQTFVLFHHGFTLKCCRCWPEQQDCEMHFFLFTHVQQRCDIVRLSFLVEQFFWRFSSETGFVAQLRWRSLPVGYLLSSVLRSFHLPKLLQLGHLKDPLVNKLAFTFLKANFTFFSLISFFRNKALNCSQLEKATSLM